MSKVVKRSDKVAFYGVLDGENVRYHRMKGFTEMTVSKNPKEYARQYIDEAFERTDVVGYATAISYGFDQHTDDCVHSDLVAICENELLASDAIRSIVIVDFTSEGENGAFAAKKRDFAVIPDGEGDSMEAYTYSGNFKTAGETVFGTATSEDGWETCVFAENL